MHWIDVQAHLEMLEQSNDTALNLATEQGVTQMITIGTHPEENKKVLQIAQRYFPQVVCTLGIHPHEAKFYNDEVEQEMEQHLQKPAVVGVGEIGLDYYYEHSDRELQKEAFRRQLHMAQKAQLPIEIHTRDAEEDTVKILKEFKGQVKGLIHCFTGTEWLAKEALDVGFDISFSGVVTFKNAQSLRDIAKWVPLDRIHVETDAPFLAPVPHRGKKNHPALIVHTAQLIADLKGVPLEELSSHTLQNAKKLFTKLPPLNS